MTTAARKALIIHDHESAPKDHFFWTSLTAALRVHTSTARKKGESLLAVQVMLTN